MPEELPWTGVYFKGVPVTLQAIPNAGFRFDGWTGGSLPNKPIVQLDLSSDVTVTARFKSSGPFMQVQSPNGGEQLSAGQKFDITWISDEAEANVDIDLSTDNGQSWSTIVVSTPNDGKYRWAVPKTFSTSARVRITGLGSGSPRDMSDAAFEIQDSGAPPSLPAITELNPASGKPGTQVTITGANLTGASSVRFGGKEASSFSIKSSSTIPASLNLRNANCIFEVERTRTLLLLP